MIKFNTNFWAETNIEKWRNRYFSLNYLLVFSGIFNLFFVYPSWFLIIDIVIILLGILIAISKNRYDIRTGEFL